jgi:hypothetical protein
MSLMPTEKLPEEEKAAPRRPPSVTEREPLTIVVVDAPPAEQILRAPSRVETRVRTGIDFEVPAEVPRRRWPYSLLVAAAVALTFSSYRTVFEPVMLRLFHGVQRRVVGERSYSEPRAPKARQDVPPL